MVLGFVGAAKWNKILSKIPFWIAVALWMLMEPIPDRFPNRMGSILEPFGAPKCRARNLKIVTGRIPCCYFWDPKSYPHWNPFMKPLWTSLEAIWDEFRPHFGNQNRSSKHHGWHSKLYIRKVEFWATSSMFWRVFEFVAASNCNKFLSRIHFQIAMLLLMPMQAHPDRFSNRLGPILKQFVVPKWPCRIPKNVTGRVHGFNFWSSKCFPRLKPLPNRLRINFMAIWNQFCNHFGNQDRPSKQHGWHSKL